MPLYLDRKPLTAAHLAAVTKKLGVTLPDAHADFLRRVNGAAPKPAWVRKKRVRDEYEDTAFVTRFFRFDRVDQYCKEVTQLRSLGVADRFLQIAQTDDDIVYLDAASGPGRVIVHEYVEGDYTLNARTAKRFEWFPSLAAFEAGFFDPTTEHKWLGLLVRNDPERIRAWLEDGGDPNLQTPYFPRRSSRRAPTTGGCRSSG
jgi:hypothetical protein